MRSGEAAGAGHERREQGAQAGAAPPGGPGVGADAVPLDRQPEEGARDLAAGARGVHLDDDAGRRRVRRVMRGTARSHQHGGDEQSRAPRPRAGIQEPVSQSVLPCPAWRSKGRP